MATLQASLTEAAEALKSANALFEERKKELEFLRMELLNLRKGIWNEMSERDLDNVVVAGLILSQADDESYLVNFKEVTML